MRYKNPHGRSGLPGAQYDGGIGRRLVNPPGSFSFDPLAPINPSQALSVDRSLDRAINLSGIGNKIMGGVRSVGRWATDNPEHALGVLGLGLEAYGGYKEGQRADEQFALTRDEVVLQRERQRKEDERQREEDERRRQGRQQALGRILARR